MKDLETRLFTENHTKDILTIEKKVFHDKLNELKNQNSEMGRVITKDKYHNNRDAQMKTRRKDIDDIQELINKQCIEIELQQSKLESDQDRNSDPILLLKRQKETTMNLSQDYNKMKLDLTTAESTITDLEVRKKMLNIRIADILKDKRKVDKFNMELSDRVAGRNVTEEQEKRRYKNEERNMKIKYQKSLMNLQANGDMLDDKSAFEETRSKAALEEKLSLEQSLLILKDQLQKATDRNNQNREDLIRLRVKNSQLDSQTEMLKVEDSQLTESNDRLLKDNAELEAENTDLKMRIATTIQRIDINNLLKEIDIEELQLLARNNKQMNFAMENMMTKWNFIERATATMTTTTTTIKK